MEPCSLAEALRSAQLFGALEPQHLEKLAAIATEVTWTEDQVVFREGETDDRLYLVVEGLVALEMYIPNRGRTTILTAGTHEVFGWSAAVPVVGKKTASARALQRTRAIAIDADALCAVCEQDHHLGYYLYRTLSHVIASRLTATRLQLLSVYAVGKGE
ncbi:MAG: Crp/Fnr family transcriptional regulator [bacterium]|nr:Crp/Fnr family transcriptional regulator [bacterium]